MPDAWSLAHTSSHSRSSTTAGGSPPKPVMSGDRLAAGHADRLPGDVAGLLGGEEDVYRGQFGGLRRPTHRRLLRPERIDLLLRHGRRDPRPPHRSPPHRVDPAPPFPP